ncbi:hypothetical protein ACFO1B_08190 [Dactylosporangium siamense]|nr:hypothetical protein [Dactylosporangium siamense]
MTDLDRGELSVLRQRGPVTFWTVLLLTAPVLELLRLIPHRWTG